MSCAANALSSSVLLADYAHARAGDKGNHLNIAVFVFEPGHYDWLVAMLTPERVADHFHARRSSAVHCHALPMLGGLNIVLENVLEGGVNQSAGLDRHGKTLSYHLLGLYLPAPAATSHQQ
ncbi:AtuA-related protein [Kushneria marisflavi]|uniref:AtuA-like ferredoxin-fold domain-containing protein n=1 Tax=Kushneria marisflavi TaxID=157779 RepID=A0A240UPQ3_9GAMM|nr:hypothetical protein [Kushneria marisflavi]ART63468.1 hypothetical protein B9H00_10675 [Kushneria marisflavi]RKD84529.1 hypothetical protein C8D96_2590 [Kushneria marisflavi]